MGASIQYAGVQLPIVDPDGVVREFVDSFQPECDTHAFAPSAWMATQRRQARGHHGLGLPVGGLGFPITPKLNTLYWPTGASRWGFGYFLCTTTQLYQITSRGASGAELILDDGLGGQIKAWMHALPARQLAAPSTGDGLYVLPLVDGRYLWQHRDIGNLEIDNDSTWSGLFSDIGNEIEETITVDDTSGFEQPDSTELTRRYENIAALLDAASISVGHRVVVDGLGRTSSQSFASASNIVATNVSTNRAKIIVGGVSPKTPALIPESCRVVFRRYYYGGIAANGHSHTVTRDAVDYTTATSGGGTVKTIHTTAFADFSEEAADPDNDADVDALAEAIAEAYYASLEHRYDYSFAGLASWIPSAFDDWIEWYIGFEGDRGAFTRVRSLPTNYGPEEQLSQFANMPVWPEFVHGKMYEPLTFDTPGLMTVWEPDGTDTEVEHPDAYQIMLHPWNIPTDKQISTNRMVTAHFQSMGERHWWYPVNTDECLDPVPEP